MIYREGGRRYIPIKFSVRNRDLASTVQDLQQQLTDRLSFPTGYSTPGRRVRFAAQRAAASRAHHPIRPGQLLVLLYLQFPRWRDAFIVLATCLSRHRWNLRASDHPHFLQHLRGGWLYFTHWSRHAGRRRLPVGSSSHAQRESIDGIGVESTAASTKSAPC